jgi:N-acyl-D-aspartate/D-glutamate deacylase
MSYDLLIKNGTVVDGLGTARRRADVAVANGKIAAIGKVTDSAKKTIDAGDLIVAQALSTHIRITMHKFVGTLCCRHLRGMVSRQ